jgi:uncharacterized protein
VSSEALHEADLGEEIRDLHRAIVSLTEELEAVDWYSQRASAATSKELSEILRHNMREEMEHACMLLEWLRRVNGDFDAQLREYLFTEGPILRIEQSGEKKSPDEAMNGFGRYVTIGSLKN